MKKIMEDLLIQLHPWEKEIPASCEQPKMEGPKDFKEPR